MRLGKSHQEWWGHWQEAAQGGEGSWESEGEAVCWPVRLRNLRMTGRGDALVCNPHPTPPGEGRGTRFNRGKEVLPKRSQEN